METDGSWTLIAMTSVPVINIKICTGCGRCVAVCPKNIITLEVTGFRKYAFITNPEICNSCNICLQVCPIAAIY